MSAAFLVFGGRSHPNNHQRPAWDRYEAAVMLTVRDNVVVDRMEYRGWELDREVGLSVCFRAATVVDQHAYTCTSTQVLKIDLHTLSVVKSYTHRLFNDLHHVERIRGRYFVAGTGVDSVLEYNEQFDLIQRYPLGQDEVISRYAADTDFRRIPTTKPHEAHPNYVAEWDGEIWATNFEAGRVESLSSKRSYRVSDNRIHDGVVALDCIWFTSVNGAVIKLDPRDGATQAFELAPMTPTDRRLGWCRGIAPVSDTEVLVGFSKLRETKLRENLKWIGNKFLNQDFELCEHTRIARYDLARGVETWRLDLEDHGMDAVYSIQPIEQ